MYGLVFPLHFTALGERERARVRATERELIWFKKCQPELLLKYSEIEFNTGMNLQFYEG